MKFYRLIKPNWAKKLLDNGEPNPEFKQEIFGRDVLEGVFDTSFISEKNKQGYNIYFFPNHPSENIYSSEKKFLSGKDIDVFSYIFIDMDLKDGKYKTKDEFLSKIKEFQHPPTMVSDSGNGIHAYWKITDLSRDMYVLLQKALISHFKTDESIWTVLQLMRVPGFNNTKRYNDYVKSEIIKDLSSYKSYSVDDFKFIMKLLNSEDIKKAKDHVDRLDGKHNEILNDVDLTELPEKFIKLLEKNKHVEQLFNNPKEYCGDRSSADMKLANVLFNKDFNKKEASLIISNSQKALSKGSHRISYATNTVDKVYSNRTENKFQTVSEILKQSKEVIRPDKVLGPAYMDYKVLGEPWRKRELLGLIAGSGVGKTATALNIIKSQIENNIDKNEVYVFFSYEMPKMSIISRWLKLVGTNSPLTDKLYVIDAYNEDGSAANIGLQEIYKYCSDIKKSTGSNLGAIVIDHLHIINPFINLNKEPKFGTYAAYDSSFSEKFKLSLQDICNNLKVLVNSLDTFGIVLTQTTKGKGVGDLPIGKDGAYGVSQYEWIMDRILTIWKPLQRIQHETPLNFLAFQYVKIREKSEKDKIYENDPKLLIYDMATGALNIPSKNQYGIFMNLLPKADELRRRAEKKESQQYSIQLNISDLDNTIDKLLEAK